MKITDAERLQRIGGAHGKYLDGNGMTDGCCVECGQIWPCPTYRWATEDGIDYLDTWWLDGTVIDVMEGLTFSAEVVPEDQLPPSMPSEGAN